MAFAEPPLSGQGITVEAEADAPSPPNTILFPLYTRVATPTNATPPSTSTTPPPYAVPWQLRPIIPGNIVRLDSALAAYNDRDGNSGGLAAATMLTGSYRIIPDMAVLLRFGAVSNLPPNGAESATSFLNPLIGGLYSLRLPSDFRLGLFLGFTVPVGMGGGDSPDPAVQSANAAGALVRSGMDGAMVAPNYFAVIPGIDLAYIGHGATVQIEASLIQLNRVRGEDVDQDQGRTNFTTGLSVGYSITPEISMVGELRYQRWLYNNTVFAAPEPAVENLSFAIGPRFNFRIGNVTVRPGIAYAQGLVGPMASGGYTSATNTDRILFIDSPVIF